ncbi:Holliday junction branch migration protein RuvA [Pedomonas mirosovicensis]|uniref:Holliday junction branch migration protein RuvA n=1 Tax=Pedomonas mirosovicensis TaxID=2908641 RepID=UPI00216A681A|nr:Holliday junction branch migration protein RuvA [Pedomonas mirosovicensis]MCH8684716.1 Holliday junction branch migration protein RuvA [Pedomonas mirosovicensis]
MFAKLRGAVDTIGEDTVIIDVNGVGYLVHASNRTLGQLPPVGQTITLFIETQVREDAITLFGFAKSEEQRWFKLLTSVQGVGARLALSILTALSPTDLGNAVAHQDKAAVARANGVGPKLAQRIVIELKDKVGAILPDFEVAPAAAASPGSALADAVSALVNLGYRPAEASAAVSAAKGKVGDAGLDDLIKAALKEAMSGRL